MGSVRTVLEVLKLSSAVDLLQHLSCVCSLWYKLSTHSEVWHAYCEIEGIDVNDWPDKPAQEAYRLGGYLANTLVYVHELKVKLISVQDLPSENAIKRYTLKTDSGRSDDNGYCLISRSRVIRFGVRQSRVVQDINLKTGEITLLPSMSETRIYPGVLRYLRGLIYLFGGRTCVCEKFHLQAKQWELLAGEMIQPLEALMPALHGTKVYLAGHTTVEVCQLLGETFTQLPFALPKDWWYCICLVDKQELVVVQNGVVGRWTIDSQENQFRVSTWSGFGSGYYSNCPPVWYQGELYSLFNSIPTIGGLLGFSPSQNVLRKVLSSI